MAIYKVYYVADGENLSIITAAPNEQKAAKNAEKYFSKLNYTRAEIDFIKLIK